MSNDNQRPPRKDVDETPTPVERWIPIGDSVEQTKTLHTNDPIMKVEPTAPSPDDE
jgi:hypothetical protein